MYRTLLDSVSLFLSHSVTCGAPWLTQLQPLQALCCASNPPDTSSIPWPALPLLPAQDAHLSNALTAYFLIYSGLYSHMTFLDPFPAHTLENINLPPFLSRYQLPNATQIFTNSSGLSSLCFSNIYGS